MLSIRRGCSNFRRIDTITKTKKPGDTLGVRGWIERIRRMKNNIFLDINDGSTAQKFQVVLSRSEQTKTITTGSLVQAIGRIQVAPNGQYELHAEEVHPIADGRITAGYPFSPKQQHAPEYVREHMHLRSRIDYIAAMMRLRHKVQKVLHDFMDRHEFVQINTPIITTNDCEGAGEVFTVRPESTALLKQMARPDIPLEDSYFDTKVFLTVSGQLHLESMSYGLGNTYSFSPAFRAENCRSPLHLAEFYMFEAELVYIEELSALTSFMERLLKDVTSQVLDISSADIAFCQKQALGEHFQLSWLQKPWSTLSHKEATEIILSHRERFKTAIAPSEGFSKEQELFLVGHCGAPVFVVDWPIAQKPFYMKVSREDPSTVQALDLLMPSVGELCGGSLRECDEARLRAHPQFPKGLEWYLELRKFGGVPTGGFGMGFERYLQLLTGVKNIRDVIPFPRFPHSCRM